jgi:hypothetical protein
MTKKTLIFLIFTILFSSNNFSQTHLYSVELLGKSPRIFDLTAEHYFSKSFSIGTGFGFTGYTRSSTTIVKNYKQHDQYEIQGTSSEFMFSTPLYFYKSFGNGKNRFIAGCGVTFIFTINSLKSVEGKSRKFEKMIIPFISAGYEHRADNNMVYRLPLYLGYVGESGGFLPKFMPWLGASAGYFLEY